MSQTTLKLLALTCTLTILITTPACTNDPKQSSGDATTSKQEIIIGGAFTLTGFGAQWGEADRQGAQLALQEFRQRHPDTAAQIRFVVEDTKSRQKGTVSAVKKLITYDDADVILGPTWLESFRGAIPVAERHNVTMLTPSASITAIQKGEIHPRIFSTWYRNDRQARELARHLAKQGVEEVAIVLGNMPYWTNIKKHFTKKARRRGVTIVKESMIPSGTTNFKTALVKIKQKHPDVIVFGFNDEQGLHAFLRQRNHIYPRSRLYTTEWIREFTVQKGYQGLFHDVHYITPEPPEAGFIQAYRDKWNQSPLFSASNAYDAMQILLQAIHDGNTNSSSIRNYLLSHQFRTVSYGNITFNHNGGVQGGTFTFRNATPPSYESIKRS